MIGAFSREGEGFAAPIDAEHNHMLQRLVCEILTLLDEPGDVTSLLQATVGFETSRPGPGDPTLENLLPPMSDDCCEAARLRALTEDFLRSEKSVRLRMVRRDLQAAEGPLSAAVWVSRTQAWDWLAALNDLRLALAGELGITSARAAEEVWDTANGVGHHGARRTMACVVYVVVTWWQDSLLRAVREDVLSH